MSLTELWVDKSNYRNTRAVEASQPELAEGEIRVAIDKFAVTANRAPSPDKEALGQLLGRIGKIGGNVNQLAKRANTDGFGAVTEKEFTELRAHISAMRAMLMTALRPDGH